MHGEIYVNYKKKIENSKIKTPSKNNANNRHQKTHYEVILKTCGKRKNEKFS